MADMLADGLAFLAEQLDEHASQSATYQRDPHEITDLPVTLGEAIFERNSQEGLTTTQRVTDIVVTASRLILNSVTTTPEPGDKIILPGIGTFEVFTPGGDEPIWYFNDPHHVQIRIHTREI